jgi:hypothetical protein
VREAIEAFSRKVNAPLEKAMQECVAILRKLIERGFVVAAPDRNAPEAVGKASGMR